MASPPETEIRPCQRRHALSVDQPERSRLGLSSAGEILSLGGLPRRDSSYQRMGTSEFR